MIKIEKINEVQYKIDKENVDKLIELFSKHPEFEKKFGTRPIFEIIESVTENQELIIDKFKLIDNVLNTLPTRRMSLIEMSIGVVVIITLIIEIITKFL